MKICIFMLSLCLLLNTASVSDDSIDNREWSKPEIIYSGNPEELHWSVDGSKIVFFDGYATVTPALNVSKPVWLEYDISQKMLSSHKSWSLQPELTDQQIEAYNPLSNALVFSSPNNQYFVFVASASETIPSPDGLRYPLTVADSNVTILTTLPILVDNPFTPRTFHVMWSADGSSFIVNTLSHIGERQTYFVSLRDEAFRSINFELHLDDRTFGQIIEEDRTYDISSNEKTILLRGAEYSSSAESSSQYPRKLLLWKPDDMSESIVIDNVDASDVKMAAFASDEETMILIVNDSGLVQYNLGSGEFEVLLSNIEAHDALFSPNAQSLVFTQKTGEDFKLLLSTVIE